MFKHPAHPGEPKAATNSVEAHLGLTPESASASSEITLGKLHELLEKNLKWSQIIYEQNRKINRKLLWSAVWSWVHALIIIVPLILGIIFLSPLIRKAYQQYNCWFNRVACQKNQSSSSADDFIKLLPLNPEQKEQLKAILK